MRAKRSRPRWVLPAALMAIFLVALGAGITLSQEEEPDVCAGYEEEAYAFCTGYCVDFDCDSEAPIGTLEECLYAFDRFVGYTGVAPPCEPPPTE